MPYSNSMSHALLQQNARPLSNNMPLALLQQHEHMHVRCRQFVAYIYAAFASALRDPSSVGALVFTTVDEEYRAEASTPLALTSSSIWPLIQM